MTLSRRCFGFLLTFIPRSGVTAQPTALASNTFRFEDLAVRKNGSMVLRQILKGSTHTGYLVDLHESDLAPGQMPHPPHHHVHEEILLINEGQIEITVNGKTSLLDPRSVAYLASGDHH